MNRFKIILGSIIGAMVLAIAVGIVFAVREKVPPIKVHDVNFADYLEGDDVIPAAYYSVYTDDPDAAVSTFVMFDDKEKTFTLAYGENAIATGTYTVKQNQITCKSTAYGTESEFLFILDDGKLFYSSSVYDGEIPEGTTFQAQANQFLNGDDLHSYNFREDGTFTLKVYSSKNYTDITETDGTYSVNDEGFITGTQGETALLPMYIWNHHLVSTVYTEITPEQYQAAIEAAKAAAEAAAQNASESTESK